MLWFETNKFPIPGIQGPERLDQFRNRIMIELWSASQNLGWGSLPANLSFDFCQQCFWIVGNSIRENHFDILNIFYLFCGIAEHDQQVGFLASLDTPGTLLDTEEGCTI